MMQKRKVNVEEILTKKNVESKLLIKINEEPFRNFGMAFFIGQYQPEPLLHYYGRFLNLDNRHLLQC